MEVIEIPTDLDDREDEIVEIAKKRNNINNLGNYTVADFLDLYEQFKHRMDDPSDVSWHENDSEARSYAFSAPDVIRMMMTLDPERYRHAILSPGKPYHKGAATSKTSLHTSWFDTALDARDNGNDDPMSHLGCLIDDIFEILDMVSHSFKDDDYDESFRKRSFYQENIGGDDGTVQTLHFGEYDGEEGWKITPTLEIMILGMFRSDLYMKLDGDVDVSYIGWMVDPKILWQEEKERVMDNVSTFYDDVGKSYRDLINSEAPYREELYEFGRNPSWPDPPAQVLYDAESAKEYTATTELSEATHWLSDSGEGLIEIEEEPRPDSEPLYKSC